MNEISTEFALTTTAIVIVLVLAATAVYYRIRLYQLHKKQQSYLEQSFRAQTEQVDRINKSIQVIAQGLLDDQLTLTEGSIRISVLLDSLDVDDQVRQEYSAFYQLAGATDHIPVLEAWKRLPTKQKLVFDRQRTQLEGDYKEFVLDAAKRILQRRF